jgi:hypothetical protein
MPVEFREGKMNRLKFFLLLILGLVLATSALHSDAMALAVDRADDQITWSYAYGQTIQPGLTGGVKRAIIFAAGLMSVVHRVILNSNHVDNYRFW